MKAVRVILSPEAEETYKYLNEAAKTSKIERSILNAVKNKTELIKSNIHYGDGIAKNLIPNEYKINYGITNLFRVELPDFWRMLYTLTNGDYEDEIIVFVLDILNHKEYNKKFGYRKG